MSPALSAPRPLVSFGLPVRNGAATIAEAIESVQAQTLEDWELVISDNLSTDRTSEICTSYAAEDSRIRYVPTGRDLSQNDNFSEAFRQARGRYFRWYGDDDWLEAEYAERSVAALEAHAGAVLCTTVQRYYLGDEGLPLRDPVPSLGGVDSPEPVERVRALLHLFEHGGHLGIDPIYSLLRRDAAARTGLVAPLRFGDFMFCCEMALLGPFVHLPELLAHRRLAKQGRNLDALQRVANKSGWTKYVQREISVIRVYRAAEIASPRSRVRLAAALGGFTVREHAHGVRRRARRLLMGVAPGRARG